MITVFDCRGKLSYKYLVYFADYWSGMDLGELLIYLEFIKIDYKLQ